MAERDLRARLMDAIGEMENPTKSKTANVGKFSYHYESLDQVLAVVRPALANHGIAMTQGQKFSEAANCWILETQVFDDKETLTLDVRRIPECSDAQQAGSWETYMRRYALRTAFGLTGEDDDGAATKYGNSQNYVSNREKTPSNAKASSALMGKLDAKVAEFGNICGRDVKDVKDALMKSKALDGATSYDSLTKDQANAALTQLIVWIDKVDKPVEPELSDEDIPF